MPIAVVLYGIAVFAVCMALHIVIWRMKVPWVSSAVLLLIFWIVPAVLLLVVAFAAGGMRDRLGLSSLQVLEVLLLHLSLACVYMAGYPAVRAVSPSLDILLMISASRGKRMRAEDMLRRYADQRLVTARIDDLRTYRLLAERDGRYTLTLPARCIARTFLLYRRFLGLPMGGG
jgi:hypothetical protein